MICSYAGTDTNAEHESDLGAHGDDGAGHKARHAAVLADTLRYLGSTADRTAEHQTTCMHTTTSTAELTRHVSVMPYLKKNKRTA